MKSLLWLVFVVFWVVPLQAEIYKWVDADGQVHYDDKPPLQHKNSKTMMDVNEQSNAVQSISSNRADKRKKLLDAIDEDRQLKKEEAKKAKKNKAKLSKQCHQARDSLRIYQRSRAVYDLDKEGNRVFLPSSARDKVISNIQKRIAASCK